MRGLPVYTLQPALEFIRLEPALMPPGPYRAPGLAVTPYSMHQLTRICCVTNCLDSEEVADWSDGICIM